MIASIPLSRKLDFIGHGFIVSLPIAMVIANRSSPLFLSCAAIFIAAARLTSEARVSYFSTLRRLHISALAGLLCAIAYPLISLSWTIKPGAAFLSFGEAVIPILAGTILVTSWRAAPPPQWMLKALPVAMMVAAGLIAVELLLNFPLKRIYGGRLYPFAQNRPVVTLLILLWPVLTSLLLNNRTKLCFVLTFTILSVIAISDSEAAKLGLLVAAATSVLVYVFSARISRVFAVMLLGLIWVQPVFGDIVTNLVPDRLIELTKAGHSRERLQIWAAFSEVAQKHLVRGTGFASSPYIKDHAVIAEVDPRHRRPLEMGHPHNAYLQVWVELGLPGTLILSWFTFWLLNRLSKAASDVRRMGLVTLMCTSAIALVSHGAWQGWWIAALALAAALFSSFQNSSKHIKEPLTGSSETHPGLDQPAQSLTV